MFVHGALAMTTLKAINRARFHRISAPIFVGAALASIVSGCSGLGSSEIDRRGRSQGWSQITLPNVAADEAYAAGRYAVSQWFRVVEDDPSRGTLASAYEEGTQRGGTGRIRDAAVNYPNRVRRRAMMTVEPRGTGCVIKCRVAVQRLDTADHRMFRQNNQFGDVPNETPIDRDAGITPQQDQVWTDIPRDTSREKEILAIVRDRVSKGEDAQP